LNKLTNITATRRSISQNARHSIKDVFDAIIELVTNADDRYEILEADGTDIKGGRIDIEIVRKKKQRQLQIRDRADGMTAEDMVKKLSVVGERVSGQETGKKVRGNFSRGAKDVAALGHVTFQSIAKDGQFHRCAITTQWTFEEPVTKPASKALREQIGIDRGTGTLVTIALNDNIILPKLETLKKVGDLVSLRNILKNASRNITIADLGRKKDSLALKPPYLEGKERASRSLSIPDYPEATAKLKIFRSTTLFTGDKNKFRKGGILIESKHAVHQATLFNQKLENDPHAKWFYGTLKCDYIEILSKDADDRFENGEEYTKENPSSLIDPNRRAGLDTDHPFVKRLFNEASKVLRPLVEQERIQAEGQSHEIESSETRKRLDELQKAVVDFMRQEDEVDETPDSNPEAKNNYQKYGYSFHPQYAKIVKGESQPYYLNINPERFPDVVLGSKLLIELSTQDISCPGEASLKEHPKLENALQAQFKVKGVRKCKAAELSIQVDSIADNVTLEVLGSAAEQYSHISELTFQHNRYSLKANKRKKVRLLAPIETAPERTPVNVTTDGPKIMVSGHTDLIPREDLGVAIAEFEIKVGDATHGTNEKMTAEMTGERTQAEISIVPFVDASVSISIADLDLGVQRYSFTDGRIEIAGRHKSLERYLGLPQDNFPGQNRSRFRVLIAEIVAEAVCSHIMRNKQVANPHEYTDADWDSYYYEFNALMSRFLPIAHKVQVPTL
tara:strand:+ start:1583 stop:3781 length:2199 start_codon:yes stop_codon:yes gene_type:complete